MMRHRISNRKRSTVRSKSVTAPRLVTLTVTALDGLRVDRIRVEVGEPIADDDAEAEAEAEAENSDAAAGKADADNHTADAADQAAEAGR